MQLGISSTAAPDATMGDLFDACARRGMTALENGPEAWRVHVTRRPDDGAGQ